MFQESISDSSSSDDDDIVRPLPVPVFPSSSPFDIFDSSNSNNALSSSSSSSSSSLLRAERQKILDDASSSDDEENKSTGNGKRKMTDLTYSPDPQLPFFKNRSNSKSSKAAHGGSSSSSNSSSSNSSSTSGSDSDGSSSIGSSRSSCINDDQIDLIDLMSDTEEDKGSKGQTTAKKKNKTSSESAARFRSMAQILAGSSGTNENNQDVITTSSTSIRDIRKSDNDSTSTTTSRNSKIGSKQIYSRSRTNSVSSSVTAAAAAAATGKLIAPIALVPIKSTPVRLSVKVEIPKSRENISAETTNGLWDGSPNSNPTATATATASVEFQASCIEAEETADTAAAGAATDEVEEGAAIVTAAPHTSSGPSPVMPSQRLRSDSDLGSLQAYRSSMQSRDGKEQQHYLSSSSSQQQSYYSSRETPEKWRRRLWPAKAITSFVRIISRCKPPLFIKAGDALPRDLELVAHWKASELYRLGTTFESVQAHTSSFFLLAIEESRMSMTNNTDEYNAVPYSSTSSSNSTIRGKEAAGVGWRGGGGSSNSSSSSSTGSSKWADCVIGSVMGETEYCSLKQARDPRLGSVWILSVLLLPPRAPGAEVGAGPNESEMMKTMTSSDFSGGDLLLITNKNWKSPLIGIVQPWDPDYDTRAGVSGSINFSLNQSGFHAPTSSVGSIFGSYLQSGGGASATDATSGPFGGSNGAADIMPTRANTLRILICVDQSSSSVDEDGADRGGWAPQGAILTGAHISIISVGNTMTAIRECQALASLKMVRKELQDAVLTKDLLCTAADNDSNADDSETPLTDTAGKNGATTKTSSSPTYPYSVPPLGPGAVPSAGVPFYQVKEQQQQASTGMVVGIGSMERKRARSGSVGQHPQAMHYGYNDNDDAPPTPVAPPLRGRSNTLTSATVSAIAIATPSTATVAAATAAATRATDTVDDANTAFLATNTALLTSSSAVPPLSLNQPRSRSNSNVALPTTVLSTDDINTPISTTSTNTTSISAAISFVEDTSRVPEGVSPTLWNALRAQHNESQLKAIQAVCRSCRSSTNTSTNTSGGSFSLSEQQAAASSRRSGASTTYYGGSSASGASSAPSSPIALLQGPPGTGKTQTILGIVSVMMGGALDAGGHVTKGGGIRIRAGASLLMSGNMNATAATAAVPIKLGVPAGGSSVPSGSSSTGTGTVSSAFSSSSATSAAVKLFGTGANNVTGPASTAVMVPDSNNNLGTTRGGGILNTVNVSSDGSGSGGGGGGGSYYSSNESFGGNKPRLLICAPSNTATDEIVHRLITKGVLGPDGKRLSGLSIVRIGGEGSTASNNNNGSNTYNNSGYRRGYSTEIESSAEAGAMDSCTNSSGGGSLSAAGMAQVVESVSLDYLVEKQKRVILAAGNTRNSSAGGREQMYLSPSSAEIRKHVLDRADIVCSTLSGAGSQPILEVVLRISGFKFDAVIIDEAAQAVEPSSLIPFKFNPQCVVMVGDPCQLPATVFSRLAIAKNYGQSLFQRLMLAGHPVQMLETQYRMHPTIANYPSERFYGSKLLTDDKLIEQGSHDQPYHKHVSERFKPMVFHDLSYGVENFDGSSYSNDPEAKYVVSLYEDLYYMYPEHCTQIGIIAPYRAQRKLLTRLFNEKAAQMRKQYNNHGTGAGGYNSRGYNNNYRNRNQSNNNVRPFQLPEISTVDGFQGREKNIVIFSCVRATPQRMQQQQQGRNGNGGGNSSNNSSYGGANAIGFLSQWQRLNVAVTRAKYALWVVGNARTLDSDVEWHRMIEYFRRIGGMRFISTPGSTGVRVAPSLGEVPSSTSSTTSTSATAPASSYSTSTSSGGSKYQNNNNNNYDNSYNNNNNNDTNYNNNTSYNSYNNSYSKNSYKHSSNDAYKGSAGGRHANADRGKNGSTAASNKRSRNGSSGKK